MILIIVFNIHESSLFITRSISSYIIAYHYQYVKHSSQQFMHVLLSITILDLLTSANKTTTCTTGARHTGVEIYMVWFKGNCSTVE